MDKMKDPLYIERVLGTILAITYELGGLKCKVPPPLESSAILNSSLEVGTIFHGNLSTFRTEISCSTPIRTEACPICLGRWFRKLTIEMSRAFFASKWHRFCSAHFSRWFARSTTETSRTGSCSDWDRTGDPGPVGKGRGFPGWLVTRLRWRQTMGSGNCLKFVFYLWPCKVSIFRCKWQTKVSIMWWCAHVFGRVVCRSSSTHLWLSASISSTIQTWSISARVCDYFRLIWGANMGPFGILLERQLIILLQTNFLTCVTGYFIIDRYHVNFGFSLTL